MKNKIFFAEKSPFVVSIVLLIISILYFSLIFILYNDFNILHFVPVLVLFIVFLIVIGASLAFIKISNHKIKYFGLFRKTKLIFCENVQKIKFSLSFGSKITKTLITIISKNKAITVEFNVNLVKEFILLFDKKIFKLDISWQKYGAKEYAVLEEIFGKKLLDKNNIGKWFER